MAPVEVDGIIFREKDKEWLERMPKLEDDVRDKFLRKLQNMMLIVTVLGFGSGYYFARFVQSVMS